ncbi:amidohydrolase [candidate division KSB1 bacterium]|nr:MAG: amidohydrolase [candidate division KSB1 bacterium]
MSNSFSQEVFKADVVLVNGKIWTSEESPVWINSVAISQDKIIYAGDDKNVKPLIGKKTEVIDLKGKFVMPGFIDAHVHFVNGGFYILGVKLKDAKNEMEFAERIREKAMSLPEGAWILEGNWDNNNWPGGNLPAKELIDEYTEKNPVFVNRYDGHMALANSLALKLAGINKDTSSPVGGVIVKDPKTGEPTGILKDSAMNLVYKIIPEPDTKTSLIAVKKAVEEANRFGVTSVQDMGTLKDFKIYQRLREKGELNVRISERPPMAQWRKLYQAGILNLFGDDYLRISGLKAFVDGSVGSNTAWFFEPYINQSENFGITMYPEGKLEKLIIEVDKAGYSVSVHAIGDRANSFILNIFEKVIKENGKRDRRFKIEHAQHLKQGDFKRYNLLDVIASVQPYHSIDDGRWVEERIGHKRCESSYAYKSFLEHGVKLAFGTDWPVAPLNPLLSIYAAVTRRTLDDKYPEGWFPEQKISLKDALLAYTINSAYAVFEENIKGSIKQDKLADIVVLSENLFEVAPDEIKDVKVIMTILGGKIVYNQMSYD